MFYIFFMGAIDGDWIVVGHFRDWIIWVGGSTIGFKYFVVDLSSLVMFLVVEVQFFLMGTDYDMDYVHKYVVGDFNGDGFGDVVWFDNVQ